MSLPGNINQLLIGAAASAGGAGGPIKSVRFNDDDTAYLSKTFSSSGNQKTYTMSLWVKRSTLGKSYQSFLSNPDSSGLNGIYFDFSSDYLHIGEITSGWLWQWQSAARYRDTSAWYHIVAAIDTTQAVAADRIKMYVNGVQVTDFYSGFPTYPTQNLDTNFNNNTLHAIGRLGSVTSINYHYDGYIADFYFIDGQQLDSTSFGRFDANGIWQAKAYSGGTYGTNGFHLFDFENELTLGHDSSGNENDFTAHNFNTNEQNISFNLDVTSTPFTDLGNDETITNTGNVSTETASSNSLNLTTVAGFDGSSKFLTRASSFTVSNNYTIDYYWNADSSQVSNATIVDVGGEAAFRDYGSATSRTIRLRDTSNVTTDYSYSTSANTWYHVRISNSGIWVNGTSVNSSPRNIAGTSGILYIGTYNNSGSSYLWNGEIGPVRISDKDLGAPPSGGLVANSDGTLSNVNVDNPDYDILRDVPTNGSADSDTGAGGELSANYATWNQLIVTTNNTLSQGNLKADHTAGTWSGNSQQTNSSMCVGSVGVSSGKWYWEITVNSSTSTSSVGIVGLPGGHNYYVGYSANGITEAWGWSSGGSIYHTSGITNDGGTLGSYALDGSAILGFALDMDNGRLYVSNNGVYENSGDPEAGTGYCASGMSGTFWFAGSQVAAAHAYSFTLNTGQRKFAYDAPSNFKCICTANLPESTIADGSDQFDALLWTGDGTGSRSFTGLSFQPDFTWVKIRTQSYTHTLFDSVRGAGSNKDLSSDNDGSEGSANTSLYGYLSSFDSTGFSSTEGSSDNDYFNRLNDTYVAWNWNAGGSTESNTDGTITSSVRANASAGFSIVTYTGNGTAGATVGHGLNDAPGFYVVKRRDAAAGWRVYHSALGATKYLGLDVTGAAGTATSIWNDTEPTSSVFSIGSHGDVNNNTSTFVAYCFAPVANYSQFGEYAANGNADGPFIYTGFAVAWVMTKRSDGTGRWEIHDYKRPGYNPQDEYLRADDTATESSADCDFLSNGFKIRNNASGQNASGGNFIYLAFAENPFQANGGLAR